MKYESRIVFACTEAQKLRDRLNSLKDSGVPAQLARGRCAGMAARRLFYRLVEETGRDLHL